MEMKGSRGSCDRTQTELGAYTLLRGHAGVVMWLLCPLPNIYTCNTAVRAQTLMHVQYINMLTGIHGSNTGIIFT